MLQIVEALLLKNTKKEPHLLFECSLLLIVSESVFLFQ